MQEEKVIYGWYNEDWGAFFYIGYGSRKRASDRTSRNPHFLNIIKNHKCKMRILHVLTEQEASNPTLSERLTKEIMRSLGEPIIDGEVAEINKIRREEGISAAKAKGVKFGRPKNDIPDNIREYIDRVNSGEITVVEACDELNMARSNWYRIIKSA